MNTISGQGDLEVGTCIVYGDQECGWYHKGCGCFREIGI